MWRLSPAFRDGALFVCAHGCTVPFPRLGIAGEPINFVIAAAARQRSNCPRKGWTHNGTVGRVREPACDDAQPGPSSHANPSKWDCRRRAKDFEALTRTHLAFVQLTMIRPMLRRIARASQTS